MSIETWVAEFYPTPAIGVSAQDAIEHSLRKWTGALPENCSKHGVVYYDHVVYVEDERGRRDYKASDVVFGCSTCALCKCHRNDTALTEQGACASCPFMTITGNTCNDVYGESAFDPRPIIDALTSLRAAGSKSPQPLSLGSTGEMVIPSEPSCECGMELNGHNVRIAASELAKLQARGFNVSMHTVHYTNGISVTTPDDSMCIGFYNWLDNAEVFINDQQIYLKNEAHLNAVLNLMDSIVALNAFHTNE